MKTKHLFLLFLLFSCVLASCNDEDERFYLYELSEVYDPNIPVSSVYVPITEGRNVGIMGGEAPYTVELSNSQLATATLSEEGDIIHLSPIRLGTTTLVVTDARGERTQIEVKVDVDMKSFRVSEVAVDISGDLDETTTDELKERILQSAVMQENDRIRWTYETKKSGTLMLVRSNEEDESITATFTSETMKGENSYTYFRFYGYCNEQEYEFDLWFGNVMPTSGVRSIGPTPCSLIVDLTDIYKEEYPALQAAAIYYMGYLAN